MAGGCEIPAMSNIAMAAPASHAGADLALLVARLFALIANTWSESQWNVLDCGLSQSG